MKRGKRNHGNLPTRTRSLRLPVALWERLEQEATRTGESMNGALWRILDASLAIVEDTQEPGFDQDISVHNGVAHD